MKNKKVLIWGLLVLLAVGLLYSADVLIYQKDKQKKDMAYSEMREIVEQIDRYEYLSKSKITNLDQLVNPFPGFKTEGRYLLTEKILYSPLIGNKTPWLKDGILTDPWNQPYKLDATKRIITSGFDESVSINY